MRTLRAQNVLVHCEGGLGRAGAIGGCYLTALGHSPEAALAMLVQSRGSPHCPETEEQQQFICDFARESRARRK